MFLRIVLSEFSDFCAIVCRSRQKAALNAVLSQISKPKSCLCNDCGTLAGYRRVQTQITCQHGRISTLAINGKALQTLGKYNKIVNTELLLSYRTRVIHR